MKKIILAVITTVIISTTTNAQCTCGTSTNWQLTKLQIGTGIPKTYKCGYQFSTTCKDTIWFRAGGYNCVGTPCTIKYKANIIFGTSTPVSTIEPFNFTTSMVVFNRPGAYRVEILSTCNNTSCKPCVYYFTVRDVGCRR